MCTSEIIFAVRESPEGGYEARAVGHSIFTEADTTEELHEMISDALRCHFGRSVEYRMEFVNPHSSA